MTEQRPEMIYNMPRFKMREYDLDFFGGPAAGEPARDLELTDLDTGERVKLSDYKGKWTVLETGSATCSMYSKNIPDMKNIMMDFPDVEYLLIYVREAHPGERLHQHKSFEEKVAAAKLLKPRYGENRKILVDTIDGDFHRAYGALPNLLYVIRPDFTIHYRCNWATMETLREALTDREHLHTYENTDVKKLKATRGLYTTIRTMWTGGLLALWDFIVAGPAMARRHVLVDAYYKKHGKFRNQPLSESNPSSK